MDKPIQTEADIHCAVRATGYGQQFGMLHARCGCGAQHDCGQPKALRGAVAPLK